MSYLLRFCLAAVTVAALAAPANAAFDSAANNAKSGPLSLLRITPAGEDVPAGRQIVFQFNRPVVPVGRMDRTAAEIPIKIEPAVACEWRWLNTSTLACQLGEKTALKPATRYRITVAPGIRAEDGNTLAETVTHEFITERPRIRHSRFYRWTTPRTPQLIVRFNQDVDPRSVGAHTFMETEAGDRYPVKVEEDPAVRRARELAKKKKKGAAERVVGAVREGNQALIFSGRGPNAGEIAKFRGRSWLVTPQRELPADSKVQLMVEPGIASLDGPEPGIEDRTVASFATFPSFAFLGIECQSNAGKRIRFAPGEDTAGQRCNPLVGKTLRFSAPVQKDAIKKNIHFTPDLAGGRKDYDPWANVYDYGSVMSRHRKGRIYSVYLPAGMKAFDTYHLQSAPDALKDVFGRPLQSGIDMEFLTDHRKPDFNLDHTVSVLEKNVDTHLPVVVTNIDSVGLDYQTLTTSGRQTAQHKELKVGKAPDVAYHYPIKIRELIPGESGALQGAWSTTPNIPQGYHYGGLRRWFFSQVTPFNAHVKIGQFNTLVWVTGLADGQPVSGARIQVYTQPFGSFADDPKILAQATTGADGTAKLPGTHQLDPKLQHMNNYRRDVPYLFLRITRGDDLALIPLSRDFKAEPQGVNGSYIPNALKRPYGHMKAWGFTAQGVYKAGDNIDFKMYVRDQSHRRFVAPPRTGYALKVYDPGGKIVHQVNDLRLSMFGACDGKFTVPKTGAVGWYRFELKAPFANMQWTPIRVLVSDFTPASFHVTTDLNGELFHPADQLRVTTLAKLHAGGPYVDAQTRVTTTVRATPLVPSDPLAKGFHFDTDLSRMTASQTLNESQGNVNGKGELVNEFKLPQSSVVYGTLSVESAVRDDRGKYISGSASAHFAGRDRYVGLRQPDWLLQSGKAADVMTLVVNDHGVVTAGSSIKLSVEYRETTASRAKDAGNAYVTKYTHRWVPVKQCALTSVRGAVHCRFTPKRAGYYRMTAHIRDTRGHPHQSRVMRWALGPGEVLWDTPPGNRLDLIPEKNEYKVGETAKLLVQNPFPGAKALITVERFGVLKSWVQTLRGSAEKLEIPVTADSIPGFYVSVTVMSPRVAKPLGKGQVDLGKPAFRMGYAQIHVRDKAKELEVSVKPRKKVFKPRSHVTVDLQVHERHGRKFRTEIAVAVLDEGVFDLITGGRNYYDPYKGFYHLDALDLANFDLLTRLVGRQKFERKGANSGGDGGGDLALRSVFKFLTYWNPSVQPDANGKATIDFDVPDNLTGWRVLAVAVTPGDRMGLGEGDFKVNQTTEIRPALPNQVTEGDHFEARFTIMNRTDKLRTLKVNVRADGAVSGKPVQKDFTVRAEPYKRYTVGLPVHAGNAGDIQFRVRASDGADGDALQSKLAVHRMQALEAAATYGTTTRNQVTEHVKFPKGIRTDVGRVSVVASPTVVGNLEGAFRYLRDYPYICWEQVLTKGVMAAHYQNLKPYLAKTLKWGGSKSLPDSTLARAADYQAPNGGMTYFIPQNRYASPYLSAYTALAFNWLRRSGYKIPQGVERNLHAYLLKMLREDVFPDFYTKGMSSTVRAVALAALAEDGEIDASDLERYRKHVPEMSLFGKAHFLIALTHVPDTDEMRKEVSDMILARANVTGGKYEFSENVDFAYQRILSSSLRTNCSVLTAMLDLEDPNLGGHQATDIPFKLVSTITQSRKNRDRWENTQENMFCMNALTDYSRVYEKKKPDMTLRAKIDDHAVGQTEFHDFRDPPKDFERPIRPGDPGRKIDVTLNRAGHGRYYYATRLFYSPAKLKQVPINSGVEIRREYSVERNGKWVLLKSPMSIKRGELVRVDLYVSVPAARNFLVVDDPVPGGLEPVNRDLATASKVDADKGAFQHAGGSFWYRHSDWHEYNFSFWSFYHKELRHDSARFYSEYLPAGNYHLAYVAQAIAPGDFSVMPVHAEEMYNPDTFGQGVPAELRVAK